ncbi:MAG: hypothetical protein R3C39_10545 [Dehalococcoidia bacterium]
MDLLRSDGVTETRGDRVQGLLTLRLQSQAGLATAHVGEFASTDRADVITTAALRGFDRLWENTIEPARQDAGAPRRQRGLDAASLYARIFVAHALARRHPSTQAVTSATVEALAKLWPEAATTATNEEQVKKALTVFRKLLWAEPPAA